MATEKCGTCYYVFHRPGVFGGNYYCHRYPPSGHADGLAFPAVQKESWCGEYNPNIGKLQKLAALDQDARFREFMGEQIEKENGRWHWEGKSFQTLGKAKAEIKKQKENDNTSE